MPQATELTGIVRLRLDHMRRRLVTALGRLSPEDLAWRPNEASNSVVNLVLHICGSLRQWLVSGVGGAAEAVARDRDAEFAERAPQSAEGLISLVQDSFDAVDRMLAELPAERLAAPVTLRSDTMTGAEVLVRMVAHTGEHLGQILYIAKARMGDRFDALSTPLRRPD